MLNLLSSRWTSRLVESRQVLVHHSLVLLEKVIRGFFSLGIMLLLLLVVECFRFGTLRLQLLRGVGLISANTLLKDLSILTLHEDFRIYMLEFSMKHPLIPGRSIRQFLRAPCFMRTFQDAGRQFWRDRVDVLAVVVFGRCR